MGSCEHPSKVVHHRPYSSAERSGWRNQSRVTIFPAREQFRVSDAELAENDDIFHSLIASRRKLTPQNPWAIFAALIFQLVLLTGLIAVPLFHVEPLPKSEKRTMLSLQAPPARNTKVNKIKPPKPTSSP